jgi:hypothetical protein
MERWWVLLIFSLSTLVLTKVVDAATVCWSEGRADRRAIRSDMRASLRSVRERVGWWYEYAGFWHRATGKDARWEDVAEEAPTIVSQATLLNAEVARTAARALACCGVLLADPNLESEVGAERERDRQRDFDEFQQACDAFQATLK